jgi:hypothetical protein
MMSLYLIRNTLLCVFPAMVLVSDFPSLINVTCAYLFIIKKKIIFPRLSLRKENFWVYHFCTMHSFWKNVGQTGMNTQLLQIYLIIINFSFYIKCISLSIIKEAAAYCTYEFHRSSIKKSLWNNLFSMVVTILSPSGWMYTYVSYVPPSSASKTVRIWCCQDIQAYLK